jgi:hypothetical protein
MAACAALVMGQYGKNAFCCKQGLLKRYHVSLFSAGLYMFKYEKL